MKKSRLAIIFAIAAIIGVVAIQLFPSSSFSLIGISLVAIIVTGWVLAAENRAFRSNFWVLFFPIKLSTEVNMSRSFTVFVPLSGFSVGAICALLVMVNSK